MLVATVMWVALAGTPGALAQRGGGFRGSGFGGRPGFAGFRGPGFRGFRPGFGGFGGPRFFGPRFFGPRVFGPRVFVRAVPWGFAGFNIGFGSWPYWGADPYFVGYGPWGPYDYAPPYGPDHGADDRDGSNPDYGDGHDFRYDPEFLGPPANGPQPEGGGNSAPQQQPSSGAESPAPGENQVRLNFAVYPAPASNRRTGPAMDARLPARNRQGQEGSELRPAVRNVIGALRAMPPAARLSQLSSGRYRGFSPEERELLRNEAPRFEAQQQ